MAIVAHLVLVLVDLPARQMDADDGADCDVPDSGIGLTTDSS